MKISFLSILFSWVKMYIEIGSMSLLNFVEWLGSCYERELFCLFSLVHCAFWCGLYKSYVLCYVLFLALFNIAAFVAYKKNKNACICIVERSEVMFLSLKLLRFFFFPFINPCPNANWNFQLKSKDTLLKTYYLMFLYGII